MADAMTAREDDTAGVGTAIQATTPPSRSGPPAAKHPSRLWLVYLAAGAVLIALYYQVPVRVGGFPLRVVLYCLVSTSAAAAVCYGLLRNRPRPGLPWVMIAASQLVYAAADGIFYISHYVFDVTEYPSLADLFYLAHFPLAVVGLLLLIRRRTPGRDLPGLLDAATLAVVAAMLSWLYVIGPQTRRGSPVLVELGSLGYPVMDLAMLTVALGLILGSGSRPKAFFLLITWLAAIMTADTIYVLQQLTGNYQAGNFLDAIWLTGNLALGACALHPTMRLLAERSPVPDAPLSPVRIAGLSAAALVAPAVLVLQWAHGSVRDVPVVAAVCALLFGLTIARLAGLVSDQRRLAITDALTSLHTRRFFEAQLPLEVARARRSGGTVAVLIADVDHFKTINDQHGHPAGDRVLVEIATRLRSTVRDGEVLARYGGEEFALILPNAPADTLPLIADRLRERVAGAPIAISHEQWVSVTVSIGTAVYPIHGEDPHELVSLADRALYAAKEAGRDRVVVGPDPSVPRTETTDYLHRTADEVDRTLSSYEHSRAIARWTKLLATHAGLPTESVQRAELAGRLHDIGKIVIPRAILTKASRLSPDEWALMRAHPDHGFRLASVVPGYADVATIIRQHHERWDGTGYPDGLAGNDIRVEARLLAVCDSWAAMRSDRPYQAALSEDRAREEVRGGRESQFDPDAADLFLDLHHRGLIGQLNLIQHPEN
ncbi:diguanylate cyclase [Actinokineospora sp. NBRC 105648]|uniref:diguanylate cyclase n=1 Tax=Actinokineospora sp. NBRC 105648 TaxID=3032206 RepID=UPI0024A3EDDE|nr:diguanylate cyclase [Actinokineospora sp. NBRC 105648]GLZ43173.1 hypothetical protein Acsp05_67970 [Actinokineospora sp. NBRC 105648]